jgi:hypothetical protein
MPADRCPARSRTVLRHVLSPHGRGLKALSRKAFTHDSAVRVCMPVSVAVVTLANRHDGYVRHDTKQCYAPIARKGHKLLTARAYSTVDRGGYPDMCCDIQQ